MLRFLIMLIVVVAIVSSLLHVSAGWSFVIVLSGLSALAFFRFRRPRVVVASRSVAAASAPMPSPVVGVAPMGGPLDEEVVFASHARSFVDADGTRLHGHGLWPLLPADRSDDEDTDDESDDESDGDDDSDQALLDGGEPYWISYDSSSLKNRSDLLHIKVAGIKFRDVEVRRSSDGGPGERLDVVPEPTNPVNPAALAIRANSGLHLGYVYDRDLADVRQALGRGWQVVSAWEWRYDNNERCALHLLVVPPDQVPALIAAARGAPI